MAKKKAPQWRRRNFRLAPEERPLVGIDGDLQRRLLEICGATLLRAIVSCLPGKSNLPGTPEEFHQFEDALLAATRTGVVAKVLEEVINAAHRDGGFVLWCMAAAARRQDLSARGNKTVTVRFAAGGETEVETPYMVPPKPAGKPGPKRRQGCRGKGGAGMYPVLAALGVIGRTSPCAASMTAKSAAELGSFEEAAGALKGQGYELHPDTVRTIMGYVADAGLSDRECGPEIDESVFAGKRVVIAPDGGRVRCRLEKAGRRRKSGYHGYETPWREPKVFAAYVLDDNGKKVRRSRPVYEGTFAPWKDAIEIAATTLKRYGIQKAKRVVVVADGSDNIWREVDRLVELLGIDPAKVVLILDFYHAIEHVHDAAKLSSRFETDKQRNQWVNKQRRRLKRGRVEQILCDLEALPTAGEENAEALRKECTYLRKRKDLLRYDKFRREHLPIGSGVVESAIRRIVNLRIKGPGIFWTLENAERLLYLRCRLKAGRWSEVEDALHRAALVTKRSAQPAVFAKIAA